MTFVRRTGLWLVLTCSTCAAQNCPQDQPKGVNPPVPVSQNSRVCRYDRPSTAAQPSYWWQLLYELFRWKAAGQPPFRRSVAFLAGVSHYNHIAPQLDFVKYDLTDLRNYLLTEGGFDTVYEVRDGNVSRDVFDKFMKGYFSDPRGPIAPEDRLLIYYSGHGGAQADVEPYLLFQNASPGDYTNDVLDVKDVYGWANTIVAKHLLIILDSCFSGLARIEKGPEEDTTAALSNALAGEPSGLLLTAGTGDEKAYALRYSKDKNGSIFTHALIDAMKNMSLSEGIVTIGEAFEHAKVSVAAFNAVENKKMNPLAIPLLRHGSIGKGNFIFLNPKAQNPTVPSGLNGGGSAITKAPDTADRNLSLIQKEYDEVKNSDNLEALQAFDSAYKGKPFGQTLVDLIEEKIIRIEHPPPTAAETIGNPVVVPPRSEIKSASPAQHGYSVRLVGATNLVDVEVWPLKEFDADHLSVKWKNNGIEQLERLDNISGIEVKQRSLKPYTGGGTVLQFGVKVGGPKEPKVNELTLTVRRGAKSVIYRFVSDSVVCKAGAACLEGLDGGERIHQLAAAIQSLVDARKASVK